MTDRQADGWRRPERHLARRAEYRTPAELMNLLTLDALFRTYGMDADELEELMLWVRVRYRGGHATGRQFRFLDDLARSLDDLAIDARG